MRRLVVLSVLVLSLALVAQAGTRTTAKPHHRRAPLTRYSLVHGCYAVRPASGHALGPFRMQATTLGEYLLYSTSRRFLDSGLGLASAPSSSTVWRVDGHFRMTNLGTGRSMPVTFTAARGCATYPEAGVDATGRPFHGVAPQSQVNGTIDAHTHVTAFEFLGGDFHCGRPWHPVSECPTRCRTAPRMSRAATDRSRASSTMASPGTPTTRAGGRRSGHGRCRPTWPRRATTTPGSSGPGWPGCV